MSPVESGHLAAAPKGGGGDNQVVIAGMPLIPRSGEPAAGDGKVFVPGPRFLSGKLRFVHCFRQVPPSADSLLLSEAPKPEPARAVRRRMQQKQIRAAPRATPQVPRSS
jgi:hypothetical protein